MSDGDAYDGAMGPVRKRIVAGVLVAVAGLTALLGLPFVVPIVNAVARRRAPSSDRIVAMPRGLPG